MAGRRGWGKGVGGRNGKGEMRQESGIEMVRISNGSGISKRCCIFKRQWEKEGGWVEAAWDIQSAVCEWKMRDNQKAMRKGRGWVEAVRGIQKAIGCAEMRDVQSTVGYQNGRGKSNRQREKDGWGGSSR